MSDVPQLDAGTGQQAVWPDDLEAKGVPDVPPEVHHQRGHRLLPCGHLDLGDSWHGGRPYQCIHEWEAR